MGKSNINWGQGIAGAAGTLTGWATDIYRNSQPQVTIPAYTNYHVNSIRSLDDLNNLRGNYINANSVHKLTAGEGVTDYLTKTAQGAAAGSAFGPWGALVGGVAGSLASIGNSIGKVVSAENNLKQIYSYNNEENRNLQKMKNIGIDNLNARADRGMYKTRLLGNYNAFGGDLNAQDVAGVTSFNNGGSHEMNPNGGIQLGVNEQGQPNLVEEGEVKWNDFIFSNRIQPRGDVLAKYNTKFNKNFATYADAANFIMELHKERENNPFDKGSMDIQMQRLADAQEYQKMADEAAQYGLSPEEYQAYMQQIAQEEQQFKCGGKMYPDGGKFYNARTRQFVDDNPDNDPYLIPVNPNQYGNNYIAGYTNGQSFYDDWWKAQENQNDLLNEFKQFYMSDNYTPIDLNNQPMQKWNASNYTPQALYQQAINNQWGPAHQAWIDFMISKMPQTGEYVPTEPLWMTNVTHKGVQTFPETFEQPKIKRQDLPADLNVSEERTNATMSPWYADALRLAPIFDNLRSVVTQNGPDYTYANQLASLYRPTTYNPQGRYQRYRPVDEHYLATQANQQRNTQYGFLRNNTQSNAAANFFGTLAAANQRAAVNNMEMQARQQNNNAYNAALSFNNQVDMANETNRMNVQQNNNSNYANIMGNSYAAAEQERLAVENAREANMNNLAQNLGNYGRELYDRWRINNDPSLSYTTGWKYKQVIPMLNAWMDFMKEYNNRTKNR